MVLCTYRGLVPARTWWLSSPWAPLSVGSRMRWMGLAGEKDSCGRTVHSLLGASKAGLHRGPAGPARQFGRLVLSLRWPRPPAAALSLGSSPPAAS